MKKPTKTVTFPKGDILIGIGPNAWRNDDNPDFGKENTMEMAISEIALAGYDGCEINNLFLDKDPHMVKAKLDLRGLRVASEWFSAFLATQPYEENEKRFLAMLDYLDVVGSDGINVCEQSYSIQQSRTRPIFGEKPVLSVEEWKRMVEGFKKLGKIAADRGKKMTYHHHLGTVVCFPDEVERLLNDVPEEAMSLCFDDSHFDFYDIDSAEMAHKFASRIGYVHLKSVRKEVLRKVRQENLTYLDAVHLGCCTVPGDGDTVYEPILQELADVGYKGWLLIEADQDPATAPEEPLFYAREGREYLRQILGI